MRTGAVLLLLCAAPSTAAVGAGRRACSMWEFSWLLRRSGAEAEYADWDSVLDAAVGRGYDCLRIDAFPHLIAAGGNATVLPQPAGFMWGNHAPVTVDAAAGLVSFMRKGVERGISFGLSTWLVPDEADRRGAIRAPEDLTRVWAAALRVLSDAGLLPHVLWVDLLNEFPLGQWSPGIWREVFGVPYAPGMVAGNLEQGAVMALPWTAAALARADAFLTGCIPPLRRAFPSLRYTFSFQSGIGGSNLKRLNTSAFDVLELHLWLADNTAFLLESGGVLMYGFIPERDGLAVFARGAAALYKKNRDKYAQWLRGHIDEWAGWASSKQLPVITTEAWGPINYDDVPGDEQGRYWEWVKDICTVGLRHAACRGWEGVATSNFAEPHFPGMWRDAAWHQNRTAAIRTLPTGEGC